MLHPAVLSRSTRSIFRSAFSAVSYKHIKGWLAVSAALHVAEFVICTVFYSHFSTPFFIPPVPTLIEGSESTLYAHSIIRQYGFFVIQFSVIALFCASNPSQYRRIIQVLALERLFMGGFGVYFLLQGHLSFSQVIPSLLINTILAGMLLRYCPKDPPQYSESQELNRLTPRRILGLGISALLQRQMLQVLFLIAGGLWMLWGLGSSIFWEIGVANISSDKAAELNLLNAMQVNFIVRNQQGVMLFMIGLITALAAIQPLYHLRLLDFVLLQQVINALSAAVELAFGVILLPQFLTVFSVQLITFILFSMLYPNAYVRKAVGVSATTRPVGERQ